MPRSLLLLVPLILQGAEDPPVPQHRNHLAGETSPYLLQHADNPVDWYPWGPEALEKALEEDKPILVSIGYSACHWCHVMERESFEDEELAKLMNRWFVCIKVDREERPDIDAIYMAAVQRMTGSGGWPLNVFLTPDLVPFFGGTYFPPRARGGRPGWDDVLKSVHDAWVHRREEIEQGGARLLEALRAESASGAAGELDTEEVLERAVEHSAASFDSVHGGFAGPPRFAPKFPRCTQLRFLLREAARTGAESPLRMATTTLDHMAAGGIHDQLAGGFHRYSTDRAWTVPHFEKMLYDNSQLAVVYLEAWQATGEERYRAVARDVLDYLMREMASPEGGFYSTTDADSEGEEGKYFVWTVAEVREVCGEDADVALSWWGIRDEGNFEGKNVLTARTTIEEVARRTGRDPAEVAAAIERCREALLARRATRTPPLLDDKVIASWNGLALSAFARAAGVLDDERYLAAARRTADFLLGKMRDEDGRMLRVRRLGRSRVRGMLEDHAFVEAGLLDLFEVDQDRRWLAAALELQAIVDRAFADPRGGYFSVPEDHERLPIRLASAQESSLPSDVGVALTNVARLSLLAGDPEGLERVRRGLARYAADLSRYPTAFGQLLVLLEFLAGNPPEVYVVGPAGDPRVERELRRWRRIWPPHRVLARVQRPQLRAAEEPTDPGVLHASTVPPRRADQHLRRAVAVDVRRVEVHAEAAGVLRIARRILDDPDPLTFAEGVEVHEHLPGPLRPVDREVAERGDDEVLGPVAVDVGGDEPMAVVAVTQRTGGVGPDEGAARADVEERHRPGGLPLDRRLRRAGGEDAPAPLRAAQDRDRVSEAPPRSRAGKDREGPAPAPARDEHAPRGGVTSDRAARCADHELVPGAAVDGRGGEGEAELVPGLRGARGDAPHLGEFGPAKDVHRVLARRRDREVRLSVPVVVEPEHGVPERSARDRGGGQEQACRFDRALDPDRNGVGAAGGGSPLLRRVGERDGEGDGGEHAGTAQFRATRGSSV